MLLKEFYWHLCLPGDLVYQAGTANTQCGLVLSNDHLEESDSVDDFVGRILTVLDLNTGVKYKVKDAPGRSWHFPSFDRAVFRDGKRIYGDLEIA